MRGNETRRIAAMVNIPCATDVQDRAIGRGKGAIHNVTHAVGCFFASDDFIFPSVFA